MRVTILLVGIIALALNGYTEETRSVEAYDRLMESYQSNVAAKVDTPYDTSLGELKKNYIAALERAQVSHQKAGQLETAISYRNEIERIQKDAEPQASDEDASTMPAKLVSLRATFDRSLEKLDKERAARLDPLNQKLIVGLDNLVTSLTVAGKLEDAVFVKEKRAEWSKQPIGETDKTPIGGVSAEDGLVAWLQEQELYWAATNANEVTMQFKGDRVTVYADGREIMKEKIEVESENTFTFSWFGQPNTFTLDTNRKSFRRIMPGGSLTGNVRRS